MSLDDLILTFPWSRYSKKMAKSIKQPRSFGFFTQEEARGMRYIVGKEGLLEDGNQLCFYLLVDEEDGIIVDAKFQLFGQSALIAAADAACTLMIGKNYDQAKRIGAELIDKQLRDKADVAAFPQETLGHINLVLDAIDVAVDQCSDIPLATNYVTPMPKEADSGDSEGYLGWLELSHDKKLAVIEEILEEEVRPYVELDAGGVEIKDLVNDKELHIKYQGACTSCYSAIGTTLSSIQQIMQLKVHPSLVVIPDMEDLNL